MNLTVSAVEEAHAVRQGGWSHANSVVKSMKWINRNARFLGKKCKKCGKAKHFTNVEPKWDKHPKVTWLTVSVMGSGSESAVGMAEVADMGIHSKPAPTHIRSEAPSRTFRRQICQMQKVPHMTLRERPQDLPQTAGKSLLRLLVLRVLCSVTGCV